MGLLTLSLILVAVFVAEASVQKRQANCKPLWDNQCTSHHECCSAYCYKEPFWKYGVCKPAPQPPCHPLWYNQCRSHAECCSKNCNRQPDWAVGFCDNPTERSDGANETPNPDTSSRGVDTEPEPPEDNAPTVAGEIRCGVPIAPRLRIIGGKNAGRGQFPWQVSVQTREKTGQFIHACGGAILNSHVVVTAAHCAEGQDELQVVAGKTVINKAEPTESTHRVGKIIIHDTYDTTVPYGDDIALLKLATPIQFDENKLPVCLPPRNLSVSGEVTATGWGSTQVRSSKPGASEKLKVVQMSVIDKETCQTSYKRKTTLTDKMLCAGAEGKDACQGDSGGPLTKKINGQHTLIGIVSFGIGCGRHPGIYTKVSRYIDWMQESAKA